MNCGGAQFSRTIITISLFCTLLHSKFIAIHSAHKHREVVCKGYSGANTNTGVCGKLKFKCELFIAGWVVMKAFQPQRATKLRSSSSSSDLLQQVGGEEAELPSRADLQVTVDLLSLLHHNLRDKHSFTLGTVLIISCSKSTTNPQRGHKNFERKWICSPTVERAVGHLWMQNKSQ